MILNKLLRNNSEIDEKKINILSKSNFSKNVYKRWVEYSLLLTTDIIKVYENENLEKIIQLELKLQSVLAYGYRINKWIYLFLTD